MSETILVAVISLFGTLGGSLLGVLASNRLTVYRIEQLEKKVEKHNNLVDRTYHLEEEQEVEKEKLIAFFQSVVPSIYRSKGFFRIAGEGWMQVDVVGSKIDFKPCNPCERSQLIFISKIGPAVIKQIMTAWQETVGQPMKLKN